MTSSHISINIECKIFWLINFRLIGSCPRCYSQVMATTLSLSRACYALFLAVFSAVLVRLSFCSNQGPLHNTRGTPNTTADQFLLAQLVDYSTPAQLLMKMTFYTTHSISQVTISPHSSVRYCGACPFRYLWRRGKREMDLCFSSDIHLSSCFIPSLGVHGGCDGSLGSRKNSSSYSS